MKATGTSTSRLTTSAPGLACTAKQRLCWACVVRHEGATHDSRAQAGHPAATEPVLYFCHRLPIDCRVPWQPAIDWATASCVPCKTQLLPARTVATATGDSFARSRRALEECRCVPKPLTSRAVPCCVRQGLWYGVVVCCTLWRLGSAALNPKTFYKSNTLGDRKKMPKFFEAPTPAPTVRMQKHRHCYCKIVHCPRPRPTLLAVCSAA